MKIRLAALAVLAVVPTLSSASTQNPFAKDAVVLDLSGLDLATVRGQNQLAIRMDQAAEAVCGTRLATVALSLAAQSRECQTDVIADIRSRIEGRTTVAQRVGAANVQVASR